VSDESCPGSRAKEGVCLDAFSRFSRRFRHLLPWVERISGGILVLAGLLMVSGYYTRLNTTLSD
jgi:hypothetical protein